MKARLIEKRPIIYTYDITVKTRNMADDGEELINTLMQWIYATDGLGLDVINGKYEPAELQTKENETIYVIDCMIRLEGTSTLHNGKIEAERIEHRLRDSIIGFNEHLFSEFDPEYNRAISIAIQTKETVTPDSTAFMNALLRNIH